MTENTLTRFLEAQRSDYEKALQEIGNAKKTGHWMWYIFPQITGLGESQRAKFYAIKDRAEATRYLSHPVLGFRLIEITSKLLSLPNHDPVIIFGETDSLKLKSSMTLFSMIENTSTVFEQVLEKFYNGEKDGRTVEIVNKLRHTNF